MRKNGSWKLLQKRVSIKNSGIQDSYWLSNDCSALMQLFSHKDNFNRKIKQTDLHTPLILKITNICRAIKMHHYVQKNTKTKSIGLRKYTYNL